MVEVDGPVRRALLGELGTWLGEGPRVLGGTLRLGGGQSSDCYAFMLANPNGVPVKLVVRLMRDDRQAARECAIQTAVAASGFPTPPILRQGGSASAFGRPYSIMAFVEGRDPVAEGAVRRLPQILAQAMCELHAVPAQRIRGLIEDGVNDLDVQSIIETLRRSPRSEIARAARWFDDHPIEGDMALCHGDLHARNILMHDGRLTALLDWEVAVFAPREYDVARGELLLLLMPGVGARIIRPLVRVLGRRAASQFLRAYGALVSLDQRTLDRCRALHALRLVALVRTEGGAADGVRNLWRPFERELAQRWEKLTCALLSR